MDQNKSTSFEVDAGSKKRLHMTDDDMSQLNWRKEGSVNLVIFSLRGPPGPFCSWFWAGLNLPLQVFLKWF